MEAVESKFLATHDDCRGVAAVFEIVKDGVKILDQR